MSNATKIVQNIWSGIKKYKYAVMILIIGIGLLLIPGSHDQDPITATEAETIPNTQVSYESQLEARLEHILSQIQGVGNVHVILTLKQGERTHYLADLESDSETKDGVLSKEETEKTVIVSKGGSYDEPIVIKKDYPIFQGALIVCDGGGDAEIRLQLTRAVAALTNLSSHNITILKTN